MTRAELAAALEWADALKRDKGQGQALNTMYLSALASALREAWAEIDRLKAHLSNPLDEALNSGDGAYRP